MSSLAHFTGVLYTPEWVLILSVFQHGCGRPRRRTDGSQAPTFSICSNIRLLIHSHRVLAENLCKWSL